MHDFSSGEGFIEVTENLSNMIKFVANEPSVGLFYVQQHAHNATSNLVKLKKSVVEKSQETSLHTEDLEDSILMVRSMKECGFPIADEMIGAIKNSLSVMSSKQPKRGVIRASSRSDRGFLGRTSSWSPVTWGRNALSPQPDIRKTGNDFSSVFNSAKQRAQDLKWPTQVDSPETSQSKTEDEASVDQNPAALSGFSSTDDFPLSTRNGNEVAKELRQSKSLSSDHQPLISLYDNYEEFKAEWEAKLEEWLGGRGEEGSGGGAQ